MRNVFTALRRNSCPKCGSGYVLRSYRKGLEQLISSFGIFPYRCNACRKPFSLFGKSRGRPMEGGSASGRKRL
jgi:DNA-directed RNA polymerase subunit RPC12/RpoP